MAVTNSDDDAVGCCKLDQLLQSMWRTFGRSIISVDLSRQVGQLANDIARLKRKDVDRQRHCRTQISIQSPLGSANCRRQAHPGAVQRTSLGSSTTDVPECSSAGPSASACNNSSSTDLTQRLRRRIHNLRLAKVDTTQHAAIVNELRDKVVRHINQTYPHTFKWEVCNSGSYYEKMKISKPNEFDCLLTCNIRAKFIYNLLDTPSKSYCAVQVLSRNWEPKELLNRHGNHGYLVCPKAFIHLFRQQVSNITRNHYSSSVEIEPPTGTSPAVTLRYSDKDIVFAIDLVPAVRLVEWPDPAKTWSSNWLPQECIQKIKYSTNMALKQCVVCKIHPYEYMTEANQCKFWRLSFSGAEKEIMLHADGTHQRKQGSSRGHVTCRKDVLRLLKDDLAKFYGKKHMQYVQSIGSFYLKTTVLELFEKKYEDRDWMMSHFSERYMEALGMIAAGLESGRINHYFIEDENLIELSEYTESHLKELAEYFQEKQNSSGLAVGQRVMKR